MDLTWRCAPFDELTPREVHDMYQLRVAVFVLEQECPFQDVDGADLASWHLLGFSPSPLGEGRGEGQLVAYARLVPAGVKFAEPSIGRVATAQTVRGTGLGRELMKRSIERSDALWPGLPVRIGAQQRLERFYQSLGFETVSDMYLEDGIPHIEMLRTGTTK
jgi:ElaA protein